MNEVGKDQPLSMTCAGVQRVAWTRKPPSSRRRRQFARTRKPVARSSIALHQTQQLPQHQQIRSQVWMGMAA